MWLDLSHRTGSTRGGGVILARWVYFLTLLSSTTLWNRCSLQCNTETPLPWTTVLFLRWPNTGAGSICTRNWRLSILWEPHRPRHRWRRCQPSKWLEALIKDRVWAMPCCQATERLQVPYIREFQRNLWVHLARGRSSQRDQSPSVWRAADLGYHHSREEANYLTLCLCAQCFAHEGI